jgi:hypothetical protein
VRASPALLIGLLVCLGGRSALAFCRTTTCDPEQEDCGIDENGCATRGQSLFWPDACVTYAVQFNGSTLRGISAYDTDQAMQAAFLAWLGSECPGGGHPSLGVIPLGGASCSQAEYNPPEQGRPLATNANLVIFRDDGWPYPDERFVIARTSITFDVVTGAILDADIEVNSFRNEFSTGELQSSNDLQGVLTHEVGHFLGLDHTLVENATMLADYALSNLGTRTLASDDRAGICSIYTPSAEPALACPGSTGPHHGYSSDCGSSKHADASCLSLAGSAPTERGRGWAWMALGLLAVGRARRRS